MSSNKKKHFNLESCVTTLQQALRAENLGADRLEICSYLETGGMTPDVDLVTGICQRISIPVRVMIRETNAGFVADDHILTVMMASIQKMKSLPIEGFVMGVMKDEKIDRKAMESLLNASSPFPVTFHKAIDLSNDINEDLHWINHHPAIDTVLTSGGADHAMEGMEMILQIKSLFHGDVMAAGKIIPEQLESLHERLQLKWYHGRNIVVSANAQRPTDFQ